MIKLLVILLPLTLTFYNCSAIAPEIQAELFEVGAEMIIKAVNKKVDNKKESIKQSKKDSRKNQPQLSPEKS